MKTQTFRHGRVVKELFHDCYCPIAVGDPGWWWFLDREVTCLLCLSGTYSVQVWNMDPYVWTPRPLDVRATMCMPPFELSNAFALDRQGAWFPWDGTSPAYAFSGTASNHAPVAVYPVGAKNHAGSVIDRAMVFTSATCGGVANGSRGLPATRITHASTPKTTIQQTSDARRRTRARNNDPIYRGSRNRRGP